MKKEMNFEDKLKLLHPAPSKIQYVEKLAYDIYEVEFESDYEHKEEFEKRLKENNIQTLSEIDNSSDCNNWYGYIRIMKSNDN